MRKARTRRECRCAGAGIIRSRTAGLVSPLRGRRLISEHLFSSVRICACAAPCSSDGKLPCRSMCSITLEVMTDPVSTADGHVYERSVIEDWLKCAALLSHICVLC